MEELEFVTAIAGGCHQYGLYDPKRQCFRSLKAMGPVVLNCEKDFSSLAGPAAWLGTNGFYVGLPRFYNRGLDLYGLNHDAC